MALAKSQKSLKRWGKQKWRTPSGKKSSETGEVYAPSKTIKRLLQKVEENLQQQTEKNVQQPRKANNTPDMDYIKVKKGKQWLQVVHIHLI